MKTGNIIIFGWGIATVLLLIFTVCYKELDKPNIEYIISGSDTMVLTGHFNTDVSKCRASIGYWDSTGTIYITEFMNEWRFEKFNKYAYGGYNLTDSSHSIDTFKYIINGKQYVIAP